jgi:hypothetical protein
VFGVAGVSQGYIFNNGTDLTTLNDNVGSIIWENNGAERMRITSGGNVGIGTSSPAQRLHVASSSSTYIQVQNTGNSVNAYYGVDTAGGWMGTSTNHYAAFYTNNTERMRITSGGDVFIGATTTIANEKLNVTNAAASGAFGVYIKYSGSSPNGNSNEFLYCHDTTTVRAYIKSNGGIGNYSANDTNLSDAREKTNVEVAGSYLDKICAIPVKTFNYIDQNLEEDGGLTLGVMAQDVQAVAPELVLESNWAAKDEPEKMRLSIYQTDLQYALMKSIQELKAIVDAQAVRIAELESK